MTPLIFPYTEREHPFFGTIARPVVTLNLYSRRFARWFTLKGVLADTGADISVIPLNLGKLFIADLQAGQPIQLGRVVATAAIFSGYVHRIKTQLGAATFEMPVAVAMIATIPPIFGRREALDRFTTHFVKGKELILE